MGGGGRGGLQLTQTRNSRNKSAAENLKPIFAVRPLQRSHSMLESCSWYAWNSHRLKQTQAGNKQPRSSFPVHPVPKTPVSPFCSAERGMTSLLLKHSHLVQTHLRPTTLSPVLLLVSSPLPVSEEGINPSRDRVWDCRTAVFPSLGALSQSSVHKGGGVPLLV